MSKFNYFFVNGHKFCTQQKVTILQVIKYFNYNTSLLVLEHNNLICSYKNWDKIFIQNNDKIEIVTIVGGG
jgi:thiamine biosynthesis protein ThiS